MASSYVIHAKGGDENPNLEARDPASAPRNDKQTVPIFETDNDVIEVSPEKARQMGFWGMNETGWIDVTDTPELLKRDDIVIYNAGRVKATCVRTGAQTKAIEAKCIVNPDTHSASIVSTSK